MINRRNQCPSSGSLSLYAPSRRDTIPRLSSILIAACTMLVLCNRCRLINVHDVMPQKVII